MPEPFVLPQRDDPSARLQLVERTLQIDTEVWRMSLADYAGTPAIAAAGVERRLAAFARAYGQRCPHRARLPAGIAPVECFACRTGALRPLLARDPGGVVYGRCDGCGHGALLHRADAEGGAPRYADAGYYRARDGRGVGYDGYAPRRPTANARASG